MFYTYILRDLAEQHACVIIVTGNGKVKQYIISVLEQIGQFPGHFNAVNSHPK